MSDDLAEISADIQKSPIESLDQKETAQVAESQLLLLAADTDTISQMSDSQKKFLRKSIKNYGITLEAVVKSTLSPDEYLKREFQWEGYTQDQILEIQPVVTALETDLNKSLAILKDKYKYTENVPKSLREIGYFRVTSRDISGYKKFLDLNLDEIPEGAVVVDSGSGMNQDLARDIESERQDITVISLDATLALPVSDKYYEPLIPRGNDIYYQVLDPDTKDIVNSTEELRRQRKENARKNTVATVLPNIPLKAKSVDVFLDLYGPAMYLRDGEIAQYFENINTTLKEGIGSAKIYPIDTFDEYLTYAEDYEQKQRIRIAKKRVKTALAKAGIKKDKIVFFEKLDHGGKMRPGIIIKR